MTISLSTYKNMLKIPHWDTFYFLRYAHGRKVVYKHSETIEHVKNLPIFKEIYKLHGQITRES